MRTIFRIAIEMIMLLLWVATATLMLRPKNCFYRHVNGDGVDTCFANAHDAENDGGHPWTDQPTISWAVGTAFSFVEM